MSKYKYVFTHNITQAKLKFIAGDVKEATVTLSELVKSVIDWNMKRFKCK